MDDAQRDTVLAALRDTGFIAYGNQHIGAANAAAVITGGALGDDAGNQGVSVARFAAALAPHGSGVLLAGRDGSSSGTAAVAVARADATVTPVISTVDDVDAESGRVTAVLGMADLINGGHTGQYGTGQARHRAHRRAIAAPPGVLATTWRASMLGWISVGRQAQSWTTALTRG